MILLFESEFLIISYDEKFDGLYIVWKGFTSSPEFRSGVGKILEIMTEKEIKKTITDLTDHRVISAEDQDFAAQTSMEFDRTHWKVKRAIITPKDVFTRFGIKQVNSQIAKNEAQERKFFATLEDAIEWIKEDENPV